MFEVKMRKFESVRDHIMVFFRIGNLTHCNDKRIYDSIRRIRFKIQILNLPFNIENFLSKLKWPRDAIHSSALVQLASSRQLIIECKTNTMDNRAILYF